MTVPFSGLVWVLLVAALASQEAQKKPPTFSDEELDKFEASFKEDEPFLIQAMIAEKGRDWVEAGLRAGQTRKPKSMTWATQWLYIFAGDHFAGRRLTGEERTKHYKRALAYLQESYDVTSRMYQKEEVKEFEEMLPLIQEEIALAAIEAGEVAIAKRNATELLENHSAPQSWNYGNVVHNANEMLGRVALAAGDVAEAKRRLLIAGKTPGSPQLDSFGPSMDLPRELLAKGERDVVIEYLDLVEIFWSTRETVSLLNQWRSEIRAGQTPKHEKWERPEPPEKSGEKPKEKAGGDQPPARETAPSGPENRLPNWP